MKRSILPTLSVSVALFCLFSCGGGKPDQDATDSTTAVTTDTTSSAATTAAPVNTIVTTPQNMMIVTHKVADFDKWLASYEAHDSMKLANGIHNYVVGRGVKDPNMVMVATKVDDIEKAKAFGKSADLKKAMQKGGVKGTPVISYTTMTYQDTGNIETDVRVRSTFTVKDWANWQRAFDSSRQLGLDNGLKLRVYGHDADNEKKVTVVSAVLDSAKAQAFYKSDQLKQLRAASGAMGEPDRFMFRVVKRY